MKKTIMPTAILLVATTVAVIGSRVLEINPPTINIVGAYGSVLGIFFLGNLCKLPYWFYCIALAFDFFATSVGSVLNVYRTWAPYDLIVHYMSGILLAALGMMLVEYLLTRCGVRDEQRAELDVIIILFALFFSAAGAGLWEIYEFTMDSITGGNMQGDNSNTMGDLVSGFAGAVTFALWMLGKRKNNR
ncbi:putative membrane protein YjdF [Clostridiales Family XIII bacterium PM5-7]